MEGSLRGRARKIREPGAYIGFLEFVVWGLAHNVRVVTLFGDEEKDLLEMFAPGVPPENPNLPMGEMLVCAVEISMGQWLAARGGTPFINHYVIGRRTKTIGHRAVSGEVPSNAKAAAMRAGWSLHETVAQGDCGIDCMAAYMGMARDDISFQQIREGIALEMESKATSSVWHDIADACCEREVLPVEGEAHVAPLSGFAVIAQWASPNRRQGESLTAPAASLASLSAWSLPLPPPSEEPLASPTCSRSPSPELQDDTRLLQGDAFASGSADCVPRARLGKAMRRPRAPMCDVKDEESAPRTPPCSTLAAGHDGHGVASVVSDMLVETTPVKHKSICQAPHLVAGPSRFVDWVRSLSNEDLDNFSSSLATWKEAELNFLKEHQVKHVPTEFQPCNAKALTRRATRLATGHAFQRWCATAHGAKTSAKLRDFLIAVRPGCSLEKKPTKAAKQHVRECHVQWLEYERQNGSLGACLPRSRLASSRRSRVPEHLLCRRRGLQGAPFKCPELRELLWDWFVDIRASIKGILSPKMAMCKAKEILEQILQQQRAHGAYSAMPQITRQWLLRWKRDFGVSLRKPNARYKCSLQTLVLRLLHMWMNNIRVRYFATIMLGKDLADQIFGIDEKPLHFNEGGSKSVGTLEIAGAPVVALKENHAATRERLSVMTCVTSNPHVAARPSNLPLEVLCKAKSNRRISAVAMPRDLKFSMRWAEKGSYREEHLLAYLRRWLLPWSQERAKAKDWKILMMDVAKSHIGKPVIDLCHEHGYVCLFHYGCTTAIAQVNDTDLHEEFSRVYIDLEQQSFNDKQSYDPSCISRSLQEVVEDTCTTWRHCHHMQGVKGHKYTGLSVALDGSEDWKISREARRFWQDAGMPEARKEAMRQVDEAIANKKVSTFEDWQQLVVHPHLRDTGVLDHGGEGGEFEGDLDKGEKPWLTDIDEAMLLEDEADILKADLAKASPDEKLALEQEPLRWQVDAAKRLAVLIRLRKELADAKEPSAAGLLSARVQQLSRELHAGNRPEARQQQKQMRSVMDRVSDRQRQIVAKARASARRRNAKKRKAKFAASVRKRQLEMQQALRREVKRRLDAVPREVDAEECGKPDATGLKSRQLALERLKRFSPPPDRRKGDHVAHG